jgi:hypothetical protein
VKDSEEPKGTRVPGVRTHPAGQLGTEVASKNLDAERGLHA